MQEWMQTTQRKIKDLKTKRFFDNWNVVREGYITFYIFPNLSVPRSWVKERVKLYKENCKYLQVTPTHVKFFIYPSIEEGKKIGITPAISFLKEREIHGHLYQSPGHELTHIILGRFNSSENLPANGFWSEGVCTYLDGTNTDRKKHVLSLGLSQQIIHTPWREWSKALPGTLYPLAASVVEYCDEVFGWNTFLQYIRGIKDSGSNMDVLCLEIFKMSYSQLWRYWREWLKRK